MESIIFFISVFLAGILSFFSPCIFPLLPVYAGVLLDDQEQSKTFRFLGKDVAWSGLIRTFCFIAGISLIFFILGFGAGFLGNLLYADWFRYVMGGIIIILGLHQMEILHLRKLEFQKTVRFDQKQSSKYLHSLLYQEVYLHLCVAKKAIFQDIPFCLHNNEQSNMDNRQSVNQTNIGL